MPARILIVEDEPALVEILDYNLTAEGFTTLRATDGETALRIIREDRPDLVVLDWMLPELSGIDICRRVRATPGVQGVPIIMLTARGEEADRLRGFDCGADDYMVKPFSPKELISRIRAILRRAQPGAVEERLEFRDIAMDLSAHRVTRDGAAIHLGPTEFKLLRTLMERPGRVLSRERLLDLVWGQGIYVEARTVDVHIRRLRVALNVGEKPDVIRTVRGAGYALDAEA